MNDLLPTLVSWLQLYGYPALWLLIYIAAIGAPLPIGFTLLAMGAFAALGDFNIIMLLIVATSASVCGDSTGYWLGRKIGPLCLTWLKTQKRIKFISPSIIVRGEATFQKQAALAIFVSRCLVPSLGAVINLLAGTERYSYRKFLLLDTSGEAIGAAVSLILGFLFGASWEAIGSLLSQLSVLILILFIAAYLSILLVRTVRKWKKQTSQEEQINAELLVEAEEQEEIELETGRQDKHRSGRHTGRKKKNISENSKPGWFPATLRQFQTYKSTDGLHTGYGFPTETTSNPGRRD